MTADRHPVPAVRAIIKDEKGRVLIVKRSNTRFAADAWCLPGGKVDFGESAAQAMEKEIREETGLECIESRFLFYHDCLPSANLPTHYINLYFQCAVRGNIRLNRESSEFHWLAPFELKQYDIVFKNDEALKQYWKI
jgi:mutator protein MutT